MNKHSRALTRSVRLALVFGFGMASPWALAQATQGAAQSTSATAGQSAQTTSADKPSQLKGMVVTGSRIRQVDMETMQPILVMDRQEIEKTGMVTVGGILSHMTVGGNLTTNKQHVNGGGIYLGGAAANLRDLGAVRVLVLVNGKRWASNNKGVVDLSTIPSAVIQRIEVLKDGASAVYGSDAISGVINIITRKNYTGAEARAYYGQNEHGDGVTQQYDFTVGTADDHSAVMMSLSYTKQDAVWAGSREKTRYPRGPRHPEEGWDVVGPKGKFYLLQPNGDPGTVYALNHLGDDATNMANYHRYTGALSDKYNTVLSKMAKIPNEQKSFYAQGHYDFTDNLTFRATAMYTNRRARVRSSSIGLRSSSFSGDKGLISADSIYNPLNQDIGFYRNLVEAPSVRELTSRTRHLDATLKGWFMVGSHYWNWDAGVTWNKNTVSGVASGDVNLRNAHRALGPSFINGDGIAKCGTPGNVISGCIPWNVLGGAAAMTPDLHQYLFVNNRRSAGSKGVSYQANLTGGMFSIPFGGEAAFAFGVERREMSGYTEPDSLALAGLSTSTASPAMDASYSVNSVYGELSIPLLRDLPWAKNLTFDIAGRYSDYSTFGSTFNAKYGFEWKPIESLLFRGNYSEAFRSPSINNMYSGVHDYYVYFLDPCDTKYGGDAYGGKVHNACIASLKAAGYANAEHFRQLDATGNPVATANPVTTSRFHYGSNPDLDAEKAVTRTLGVVYSPAFAPGLDVSLDWYEIKIRDAIGQVTPQGTVENCYLGDASYCAKFQRNSKGQLVGLRYGLGNMGKVTMEGYDLGISYSIPDTGFGAFKVTSNSSYLVRKNSKWGHDAPIDTQVSNNVWRLRNNTSFDWAYGNFGATWTVRYFSSVREPCDYMTECNMPNFVSPYAGAQPTRRIGAIAFNDLSVRWNAPWNGRITLGVNNIFDREAPIQYGQLHDSGSIPYNPAYDLDRYFFVNYNQKF